MNDKKIRIKELKVKSFITNEITGINNVKGGTGTPCFVTQIEELCNPFSCPSYRLSIGGEFHENGNPITCL